MVTLPRIIFRPRTTHVEMAAVHCVDCISQVDDSRERRVLLDVCTRHVLPYLDELTRSLDSQYDEFTRYIVLVDSFSSNENCA